VPGVQDRFDTVGAVESEIDAVALLPPNTAVITAVPLADKTAAALKLALVLP
jgi:hypothetical protein